MPREKEIDRFAMFQSYRGAAAVTGLSYKFIRSGCLNGTIPCIRVGSDMRVNMPLFLEQLNEASKKDKGAKETQCQ